MKRLAKDGRPFHLDDLGRDSLPEEVEVIQYLRPGGSRRRLLVNVGKHHTELAADMILSAEVLTTGMIALWIRFRGEPVEAEEVAIAPNENDLPIAALKDMIERKAAEKKGGKHGS